jgi:cobalamin biosynthesis protein CobT
MTRDQPARNPQFTNLLGTNMNKAQCEQIYAEVLHTPIHGIAATKAKILAALRSIDFVGWSTREESGRLDRRAYTRFAAGQANIFSRRELKEADTAAVSILIDCSWSMSWSCGENTTRIVTAQAIAIQLASIIGKSNAAFEINGFKGPTYTGTGIPVQKVMFLPFKQWGESLQRAAAKLGSMNEMASGGTPDYSAVHAKLDELSRRPEARKVFFVITDADSYKIEHMKYLQDFADKRGISVVAIGIGDTQVTQCFKNAENVKTPKDMASKSFGNILKAIA